MLLSPYVFLFVCTCGFGSAREIPLEAKVIESWKRLESDVKSLVENLYHKIRYPLDEAMRYVAIGSDCFADLQLLMSGVRDLEPWAIKMLDANGKPGSGLLNIPSGFPGAFDECLDVVLPRRNQSEPVRGQYCTVEIMLPMTPLNSTRHIRFTTDRFFINQSSHGNSFFLEMLSKYGLRVYGRPLLVGTCLPSSCERHEFQRLLQFGLKRWGISAEVEHCHHHIHKTEVSLEQAVVIFSLSVVLLVIVLCTLVDISAQHTEVFKKYTVHPVCKSLSMVTSLKDLLGTRDSRLSCLNGIKSIAMMWIILDHSYTDLFPYWYNMEEMVRIYYTIGFEFVANAMCVVDTFFLVGAVLLSYCTMKVLHSSAKMSWASLFLARYLRLSPLIWTTLGLLLLCPLLGTGPGWTRSVVKQVDICYSKWWEPVFLLGSLSSSHELCLPHTWYLSADFVLFAGSLPFIYALYRHCRLGVFLGTLSACCACFFTAYTTVTFNYEPAYFFDYVDYNYMKEVVLALYVRPHNHVGPYVIGLFLGYFIFRHQRVIINKMAVFTGWTVSLVVMSVVIYSPHSWRLGSDAGPWLSAAYQSLYKSAWGASLAWIIFACVYGYGGFANSLLSWTFFGPLSKLAYGMYLIQMLVLWIRVGAYRTTFYFNNYNIAYEFAGNFLVNLLASTFLFLTIESPFGSLLKLFFSRRGDGTKGKMDGHNGTAQA